MEVELAPFAAQSAGLEQNQSCESPGCDQQPPCTGGEGSGSQKTEEHWNQEDGGENPGYRVQQNNYGIKNVGLRKGIEVCGRDGQKSNKPKQNAIGSLPGIWHFLNGKREGGNSRP